METQEVNEVELKQEGLALNQEATGIAIFQDNKYVVKTEEQFQIVSDLRLKAKAQIKRIQDYFKPIKQKQDEAKKVILDKEKEALAMPQEIVRLTELGCNAYVEEQDAIKEAAQRKLDEEAARKRKELEEKSRIAAEAGKEKKAEKLLEKAEATVAPIVAPSVQTTTRTEAGVTSIKRHTEVTIVNPDILIQQIAKGIVPSTVVEISESKLVKWIDAAGIKTVPGLAIRFNVPGLAGRSK